MLLPDLSTREGAEAGEAVAIGAVRGVQERMGASSTTEIKGATSGAVIGGGAIIRIPDETTTGEIIDQGRIILRVLHREERDRVILAARG
jgi:hypothetical protein